MLTENRSILQVNTSQEKHQRMKTLIQLHQAWESQAYALLMSLS